MNDNIIYIVFFSIFIILVCVLGYIIYDYYAFKTDMNEDLDADMNAIKKFQDNYDNYKNVLSKLSGLVRNNQEAVKALGIKDGDTKMKIDELNADQETKLKIIDDLLKKYKKKLTDLSDTHKKQKSSYVPFNNEAEIVQELKKIEKDLYKYVHNFVLTKREIYKLFEMFEKLDVEHNESILGLASKTIEINTILLTLLEYNDEVHKMIDQNWDKFVAIKTPIEEPDLTTTGLQIQTNSEDIIDLLTKFAQNRHEIDLLKQGTLYTQGVLQYISEELKDITEGTQNVLAKMNDLDLQASTFQTRLDNLNIEHENIRGLLEQMGLDITTLEGRLSILEQRNEDIGPLLEAIASAIQSNNTEMGRLNERDSSLRETLSGLQETTAIVQNDIDTLNDNVNTTDISGFDRALKHFFGFKHNEEVISDSLYTHAFSGGTKDLELKHKTNMNSGLTIRTSGDNSMRVCKDGSEDCMGFGVSGNDFNMTSYNNVNTFKINGNNETKLANFDLENNNIYMGGHDDNATMTIKDGRIVFNKLFINGNKFCRTVAPPVAVPVVSPNNYNFP